LDHKSFHKNLKINGVSFISVDEVLKYAHVFSYDIFVFLESWFSNTETIAVKSSGSTGKPKTILLQKKQMINSALVTGKYFDLQEDTTALLCLPIAYIAAKMMLIRAIVLGWHIDVIESNSNPLKDIHKTYDFSAMVPLQLDNSLSKIDIIKKIIVGGGVVSNSLQGRLQTISSQVFATYGMTETITHIAVKRLNNFGLSSSLSMQEKSFYQILPNITIYKDERNCLVIKAPKISKEIIFTNDVVNLISDVQFEWVGRFDNVINSGGIKLHPEKIEEKLSKIIFNRFFVAGIPDEKLGEKLVLIIENNNFENDNSNEINKSIFQKIKLMQSLSKFEIPKKIYFLNEFVETKTGKIQRIETIAKIFLE